MKKFLVALTILAVAAVAQAEIVATWTATTWGNPNNGAIDADGPNTYGFALNSAGGFSGTSSPAGGTIAVGGGATEATASAAITATDYLYFTWDTDYTFAVDSIEGRFTRGNNGAVNAQYGTLIGGTWTGLGTEITVGTSSGTAANYSQTSLNSGSLESGELALAVYNGTGTSATDWFRVVDSRPSSSPVAALTLDGTMTAIPEPATMSLLGLGALAMVIRRKIKK